ncbi:hypothetical protein Acr_10g0003280 [Actinidia rufa]|uniref:TF-B3 domain-containing protein n=1 Tax=Actinidia rufa TaxID=165716 RepID=A0A7J0F8K9_9ERIC|nr:hypothetical protein Acr_10g0003280 [Actinidia rufa]
MSDTREKTDTEEEMAASVSEEQNPSSSSPSTNASDTKASDKRTSGEENVDSLYPFEVANQQAQMGADPAYLDDQSDSDSKDGDWPDNICLFEREVPHSNRFLIPMLWPDFVNEYNLKPQDVISFYQPLPRLNTHHFAVEFIRRHRNLPEITEFRRGNFLFQLELSPSDVEYLRLFLPTGEVMRHFPAIQIPPRTRKAEIVKFADDQNKDWYMDVMRYNSETYMIMVGWDGFVKEKDLKAMDVIWFYNPVEPSHEKHFLIVCVKTEDEANLAQSSCEKQEEEGKQGDYGGVSQRGSYKGKEIAVG